MGFFVFGMYVYSYRVEHKTFDVIYIYIYIYISLIDVYSTGVGFVKKCLLLTAICL